MAAESPPTVTDTVGTVSDKSDVVFFLGAGASVAADVPDTRDFVGKFRADCTGTDASLLDTVLGRLRQRDSGDGVDVESLLRTLTKLRDSGTEVLLDFCKDSQMSVDNVERAGALLERLKQFIWSKGVVDETKVEYLEAIRQFIDGEAPLDIVSTNYDTCIEQFCNVQRLTCRDGFDINWNPKSLDLPGIDVRLYKLHGSVTWFETDRGDFLRIPVKSGGSGLETIFGEQARSFVLYPMEKWYYAEPLLDLLSRVKALIQSPRCRILIVAGYSFRDEHLRSLVLDAARRNKKLVVMLVDPLAPSIYEDSLRFYDKDKRIRTHLDGRVVCLPYRLENVLPFLKLRFVDYLRNGLQLEEVARADERSGQLANWLPCLQYYVHSEYVSQAVRIFETRIAQIDFLSRDAKDIALPFMLARSLYRAGDISEGDTYSDMFRSMLNRALAEQLRQVAVLAERQDKPINLQGYHNLIYGLQELRARVLDQRSYTGLTPADGDIITGQLLAAAEYLSGLTNGYVTMPTYLPMRRGEWPNETASLAEMAEAESPSRVALRAAIIEIERKEIKRCTGLDVPVVE